MVESGNDNITRRRLSAFERWMSWPGTWIVLTVIALIVLLIAMDHRNCVFALRAARTSADSVRIALAGCSL